MNTLVIIITGILGATLTFYFNEHLKQGPVRSSAMLSLIVGLLFYLFPELLNPFLTKNIPVVFIGGSFIGMISFKAKGTYVILVIASIIFSCIYLNKSQFFNGYGGALGNSAFIALLITMGVSMLFFKRNRLTSRILLARRRRIKRRKARNKK
ncbi:hypothetical protein [Cellulophaga sp. Asnod2-G02]|uniref:hypothetical protein n=1 Tax=Cellulophaga sp. Asnod2-G02 TaxID=3160572 RepID=UPI003869B656